MKPPEHQLGLRPAWTLWRVAGLAAKGLLPLAVLAGAAWGYMALQASKPQVPQIGRQERVYTVETVEAAHAAHRPRIVAYGTITPGRQVALRALVAGEVVSVGDALREGGIVAAGEPLVAIDPFQYEGALVEARADLEEARARQAEREASIALQEVTLDNAREQLEIAQSDLDRARTLSERGSMAQQSLETRQLTVVQRRLAVHTAESTLEIQRAQLEQLHAQIARLEWRVQLAERNLSNVVLKAPFDAYVGSVAAEVGKLLSVNDVVGVLVARDEFDVRFSLTDAQYGRLVSDGLLGRPVAVTWRMGGEMQSHRATIVRVAPEIASQRGGVDVYARIENEASPAHLRPGAFVEVELDDRTYDRVVRVPSSALYGTDRIYVVEDGRLAGRAVEIVGYDGADLLVRGELADGERIVTTRITGVGHGLKVQEQTPAPAEDSGTAPAAERRDGPERGGHG